MSCCPFSTPTRCIPVASLPWGRQPIDQVKAPPRPHGCQRSRHKRPHAGPPPAPLAVIRLGQPLLPALVYEDASPGGRETSSGRHCRFDTPHRPAERQRLSGHARSGVTWQQSRQKNPLVVPDWQTPSGLRRPPCAARPGRRCRPALSGGCQTRPEQRRSRSIAARASWRSSPAPTSCRGGW